MSLIQQKFFVKSVDAVHGQLVKSVDAVYGQLEKLVANDGAHIEF